jgi:hypothetical protein
MLRGRRARALVAAVLPQLEPYFSERVRIRVVGHRQWLTITHFRNRTEHLGPSGRGTADEQLPAGGGATITAGLGTWIPFLPARVRRRLVAQDVVETLLAIGTTRVPEPEADYHVVARDTAGGVMVAFDRPGSAGDRVEIGPISHDLLS